MKISEDVYLEHYGKKGMRWGQKSGKQKLGTVGGIAGGVVVGTRTASRFTKKPGLQIAVGVGAGVLGKKIVDKQLAKNGKTKVSDIK